MKKYFLFIFCITLLFSFYGLFAKPIDIQTIKTIGANFLKQPIIETKVSNTFQSNYAAYYILHSDSGFVIIAGNDVVTPIIGYSYNSSVSKNNELPDNLKWWLESKANDIHYAIENNITASEDIKLQWENLLHNQNLSNKDNDILLANSLEPLCETKWDQTFPYNSGCPGNSPTGCVATAMAQIMKYWEYPKWGIGTHCYWSNTYQKQLCADFKNTAYSWNNMPNKLDSNSNKTYVNAIAELMYHCGVAVEMIYWANESGAYTTGLTLDYPSYPDTLIEWVSMNMPCALTSLTKYFGYKNTIKPLPRHKLWIDWNEYQAYYSPNYTTDEWINILKTELDAKRPILYSGGGHAFICDGYNSNDYLHFNWGWSGMYDGYFNVDKLSPGTGGTGAGTGTFNGYTEAIIMGIESPNGIPLKPPSLMIATADMNYNFGAIDSGSTFKVKEYKLSNGSSNQDLKITSMKLSNDTDEEVYDLSGTTFNTIAPNGERNIILKFTPKKIGKFEGKIIIKSNATNSEVELKFQGEVKQPPKPKLVIATADMSYDFGVVDSGSSFKVKEYTLSNNSNLPLQITSIKLSDDTDKEIYDLSGTAFNIIAPDSERKIILKFTPNKVGKFDGKIIINSNASNSEVELNFKGEVLLPKPKLIIATSDMSYNFGVVDSGSSFKVKEYTLSNNSSIPIQITSINLSDDTDTEIYNLSGTAFNTIAPDSERKIILKFTSAKVGIFDGKIIIISNASNSEVELNFTGEVEPNAIFENTSFDNIVINPNPASDNINLTFDIQKAGNLIITLNNILGQELFELYNAFTDATTFTKTFSIAELPIGVYYLKITHNGNVKVEKVIKN